MRKVTLALFLFMAFSGLVSAATTHTVKRGDTLWDMAAKYYGDPTLYTIIAEVNGVTNPRTILNGTVLVIPNKSDMDAIASEKNQAKRQQLIEQAGGKSSGSNNNNNNNNNNNSSNNDNSSSGFRARSTTYQPPKREDTSLENVLSDTIYIDPKKKATVE
jgi:LysM repeat protein